MRAIAIIQARMTSTRLPGKVMLPLAGAPLLQRVMERMQRVAGLAGVCLAIPEGSAHKPLADLARQSGWTFVEGPEDDVLERYCLAAEACSADYIMRVTSDCPLIDPAVCASALAMVHQAGADYGRTAIETGYPLGLDLEVIAAPALFLARREATDPFEREHVTPYIWRRPEQFGCLMLDRRPDRRMWRLTVDTPEDYDLVRQVFEAGYTASPHFDFSWIEDFLLSHPDLLSINAHIEKPAYTGWKQA